VCSSDLLNQRDEAVMTVTLIILVKRVRDA
jgi:hypothetical protein